MSEQGGWGWGGFFKESCGHLNGHREITETPNDTGGEFQTNRKRGETAASPHPPNLTGRAGVGRHQPPRRPHQTHRQTLLTRRDLCLVWPEEQCPRRHRRRHTCGHSSTTSLAGRCGEGAGPCPGLARAPSRSPPMPKSFYFFFQHTVLVRHLSFVFFFHGRRWLARPACPQCLFSRTGTNNHFHMAEPSASRAAGSRSNAELEA